MSVSKIIKEFTTPELKAVYKANKDRLFNVTESDYPVLEGKSLQECHKFIIEELVEGLEIWDELAVFEQLEPINEDWLFERVFGMHSDNWRDVGVNDCQTGEMYARVFGITDYKENL